jgi:hypothetical protein
MLRDNCLTADEMTSVVEVFIECFNVEYLKLPQSEVNIVDMFLVDFCAKTKLHTLFTPAALQIVTDGVFSSVHVRDFVLSLMDRFYCITALNEMENRSIEYSIAFGINRKHHEDVDETSYVLIPERVYNSLAIDGEEIVKYLHANSWLTCLILLFLFVQRSHLASTVFRAPPALPLIKT